MTSDNDAIFFFWDNSENLHAIIIWGCVLNKLRLGDKGAIWQRIYLSKQRINLNDYYYLAWFIKQVKNFIFPNL